MIFFLTNWTITTKMMARYLKIMIVDGNEVGFHRKKQIKQLASRSQQGIFARRKTGLNYFSRYRAKAFNTWCSLKDHTCLNKPSKVQVCLNMYDLLVDTRVKWLNNVPHSLRKCKMKCKICSQVDWGLEIHGLSNNIPWTKMHPN